MRMDLENKPEKECEDIFRQIEEKQYAKKVEGLTYKKINRTGIVFFQKQYLVKEERKKNARRNKSDWYGAFLHANR